MMQKDPVAEALWQTYFSSKETNQIGLEAQKNNLLCHYYPLVRKIAIRLHQRITELNVDELTSMGVDGLVYAIDHYDPEYRNKFETYASPRIRGSMLDEIRKLDWVPRSVRSNVTNLENKKSMLESEAGHRLSNSELAELLNETEEDFDCLVQSSFVKSMNNISVLSEDEEKVLGIEHIEDRRTMKPIQPIIRREFFQKLMGKNFTPQERKIIWLYYFEDLSMKEISKIVGLSESRVSQMHGNICERLQQKAKNNPEYFSDIESVVSDFKDSIPV